MKRTAQAMRWNNEKQRLDSMGEITCEVTGEWSGRVKCWTEIGKPCGNQYSLNRWPWGGFFFCLEAEA